MRLSTLQKFILNDCYGSAGVFKRNKLMSFYDKQKEKTKKEDQQNTITKSLERLIDKGLMIGYGRRTPEKWFIDDIKLTAKGRRTARSLLGQQRSLPLRLQKVKK